MLFGKFIIVKSASYEHFPPVRFDIASYFPFNLFLEIILLGLSSLLPAAMHISIYCMHFLTNQIPDGANISSTFATTTINSSCISNILYFGLYCVRAGAHKSGWPETLRFLETLQASVFIVNIWHVFQYVKKGFKGIISQMFCILYPCITMISCESG